MAVNIADAVVIEVDQAGKSIQNRLDDVVNVGLVFGCEID